jgi:hypothetical protein
MAMPMMSSPGGQDSSCQQSPMSGGVFSLVKQLKMMGNGSNSPDLIGQVTWGTGGPWGWLRMQEGGFSHLKRSLLMINFNPVISELQQT